jgi:hypothetical protein
MTKFQEKKIREKKQLFHQICQTLQIKKAIKKFGKKDVLWALRKYNSTEQELTALQKDLRYTQKEIAKIENQI